MIALLTKRRASGLPWATLAVEFVAIALSVMLGFAVTEWREGRREDALRRETLENFRTELLTNRERAADALPYHEAVLDRTRAVLLGGGVDTLRHMGQVMQAIGWKGPGGAYLARTALRAAESTGSLGLLDFETAGAVADAYEMQETLDEMRTRFLTETAYNPATYDATKVREALSVMMIYFDATTGTERELLPLYGRALGAVATALGEPPPPPLSDSTAARP